MNDRNKEKILTIKTKLSVENFYKLKEILELGEIEGLALIDAGIEPDSRPSIEDVNLVISALPDEAVKNSTPAFSAKEMLENLKQLYQNLFEGNWLETAPARDIESSIRRVKEIELGANQSVVLFVQLTPESDEQVGVVVRISPGGNAEYLPLGLKVEALEQSGKLIIEIDESGYSIPMETITTENDLELPIEMELDRYPGDHFKIRLTLQNVFYIEKI